MPSYNELFENNKNWVREKLAQDKNYFKKMAKGQSPKYLFIGCSDSRVPANEITGTDPGEMFVHRNIANLVVHTDMNLMSVLQYAIDVLKIEHIIVCGHYGCGGVKAAMENVHHGLIDKWLRNIKDIWRIYRKEVDALIDPEEKFRKMVELNVREQVYHVAVTDTVQNAWDRGQEVKIHGWVYDIHDGYLSDLRIDLDKEFRDLDLYRYKSNLVLS
jgi:carbonic anhydrase